MTDSGKSALSGAPDQTPVPSAAPARKPRVALFLATAAGLGYIPLAPGTWGSFAGVLIYVLIQCYLPLTTSPGTQLGIGSRAIWASWTDLPMSFVIAVAGVWVANRASTYSQKKDPQFVVVDEVSGQHLTYMLGLAPLSWKYLLLGLILFRVFDIWKPFPVRQAESLPGGWGIMADDWIAAIYAALGLWIARAAGL